MAVIAGVDQFDREIEVVTLLDELPCEDGFYAELLADDFRIDVFVLVCVTELRDMTFRWGS